MEPLLDRLTRWFAAERPAFDVSSRAVAPEAAHPGSDDLARWFARVGPLARAAPADDAGCALRDWRLLDRAMSEEARMRWREALAGRQEFEGWWHPAWVPLLERCDGDLLVVDTVGVLDAPGAVVEVVHDAPYRYVRAASLTAWLEGLVGSLEAGDWSPDDHGLWWDDPDLPAWEHLGAHPLPSPFPRTLDLGRERSPSSASPTTAEGWLEAWRSHLHLAAAEARWAELPRGWCTLRWRSGGELDAPTALPHDAPPTRRALEFTQLAAALHGAGHPRADELTTLALASPAAALAAALVWIDLSSSTLRARVVDHALAQATACAEGAAALCAALAAALTPHDPATARTLLWWSRRLRPTPETAFAAEVTRCLASARAEAPDATTQLQALLRRPHGLPLATEDAALVHAAVVAAHALLPSLDGVLDAVSATSAHGLVALRALVSCGLRERARARVLAGDDPAWHAARWSAYAHALPSDDADAEAARAAARSLVASPSELAALLDGLDPALPGELRLDRANLSLRSGAPGEALAMLDAWRSDAVSAVRSLAARHLEQLDDALVRPTSIQRAPTRAEFATLAAAWRPAQLRDRATQRVLLGAAAHADDAAAPPALARIEEALRASFTHPGRFGDALALALVCHGRVDDALAAARAPGWWAPPGTFLALVAAMVRANRRAEALSLGDHLTRGRDLRATLELAPAVALVAPDAPPSLRATLDALR